MGRLDKLKNHQTSKLKKKERDSEHTKKKGDEGTNKKNTFRCEKQLSIPRESASKLSATGRKEPQIGA